MKSGLLVCTGVTAVLPRGHHPVPLPVWAGQFDFNGNGEMTGTHWVRGKTAVTPVQTCGSPPPPKRRVVKPTSTPGTSVMALNGPGVPGSAKLRSRARGLGVEAVPVCPVLVN